MLYLKPSLKNLSQGARLEYVREFRHMSKDEVAVGINLYEKHTSKPYNPLIANVFFLAGFIESWGRGFEKIKEECEKTKTPLPEIKISSGGVRYIVRQVRIT